MTEYQQKTSICFYCKQKLTIKLDDRATSKALENGWNGLDGKERVGKKPNKSGTITELIEIGFIIVEQFGEDWKDNLALQSEPPWAKEFFDEFLSSVKNLSIVLTEKQTDEIEEVYPDDNDINLEGMLE